MCNSNSKQNISKPKFKAGDKVKCVRTYFGQYVNEGEIYTVKNIIQGSFEGTYVILEEIKRAHNYDIDRFELVVDTPKNYRELTPDTLIDISIDGNEFKVPLGDLVHAQALIGVANGKFGNLTYTALKEVLDEGEVIFNTDDYGYVDTFRAQESLIKSYFIDKEKEAKKQALKDVIEKQREEISKLEQQLIELDDYDGCSL